MRRPSLVLGAALGALTSLPLIALSFLGEQLMGLPFVPFDLFDWLARVLPGDVIRTGIAAMVQSITLLGLGPISDTAKRIEQLLGVVLVIVGGAFVGSIVTLALRNKTSSGRGVGALAGALVFLVVAGVEQSLGSSVSGNPVTALFWLALLIVGWGTLLGGWLAAPELTPPSPVTSQEFRITRRALLIKLIGGSAGAALAAWGIARLLETPAQATGVGQVLGQLKGATPAPTGASMPISPIPPLSPLVASPPEALLARILVAPGTRPELTATQDFYRIDVDALPPVLSRASWVLQVGGLFDRPRPLMLSDLLAYPAVTQPITLSCISNPVGGDLISTGNWIGAPLRDVLKDLGLRPEAQALNIKSADGFFESVEMADMMDPRTLLVYGMNGETLPIEHGFPLRIYIPNRYGMKQPKWITSIEAVDRQGPGYWVVRGWSAEARPQIVSVIDTVAKDNIQNGLAPIGGIAWAGERGIQKVQVQVDDGPWVEAVLRTPPLSSLTWVQWRYDWPAVRGTHTFHVRATDGTGALQIESSHDTFPNGATGYHSVTVTT